MSTIDEAFLAERERIRGAMFEGEQPWLVVHRDPLSHLSIDSEGGSPMARCPLWGDADEAERVAAHLVDAHNHQPALIAEIRRLRLLVMEAFDAASLAASTHIDYDPDAAHQAVREARAAVVAKLEARKLHPEFERLEQKFDPRGPTPPWFVGGGA